MEYIKQAEDFLNKNETSIKIVYVDTVTSDSIGWGNGKFKMLHDKYRVTLKRGYKSYTFTFYGSNHMHEKKETPTSYDILASLEKYEVPTDTYEFANEFGYEINDNESFKKVNKIKNACLNQYNDLLKLFDYKEDIMDELREIQ